MAWTGTATVKKLSDRLFRITGLTLIADASGTIGFSDKTVAAEVSLEAPTWQPYENSEAESVTLAQAVRVLINIARADSLTSVPISIVKSGTTHADFALTFHNDVAGGGQTSPELEIYIEYH